MYVIAKTTKLKRMGEIYKEEVIEKHYKKAVKVETTSKMVFITYKESRRGNGEETQSTEALSNREVVGVSIFES